MMLRGRNITGARSAEKLKTLAAASGQLFQLLLQKDNLFPNKWNQCYLYNNANSYVWGALEADRGVEWRGQQVNMRDIAHAWLP